MAFSISSTPNRLNIGHTGENLFRTFEFNVSEWITSYPTGTISLIFYRSDGQTYLVTFTLTDNIVYWKPTSTDLDVSGNGRLEIRITSGSIVGKSAIINTITDLGLGSTSTAPITQPDWVQTVIDAKTDTISAKDTTVISATSAAESATAALGYKTTAEQKATEAAEDAAATEEDRIAADLSAQAAANNLLNGVSTHNASDASHADIREDIRIARIIAEGAVVPYIFETYSEMVSALNAAEIGDYILGRDILVPAHGIPDLWIYSTSETSVPYTYTSDSDLEAALDGNLVQIGHYTVSALEGRKVDLTTYATKAYVDTMQPIDTTESEFWAMYNAGTLESGRKYDYVEDAPL